MYNSTDIKLLLGKRIKELRKQKGLTQEQLAEKMNIDQRNLSKILIFVFVTTNNTFKHICRYI